jgi:hypothetical protein
MSSQLGIWRSDHRGGQRRRRESYAGSICHLAGNCASGAGRVGEKLWICIEDYSSSAELVADLCPKMPHIHTQSGEKTSPSRRILCCLASFCARPSTRAGKQGGP